MNIERPTPPAQIVLTPFGKILNALTMGAYYRLKVDREMELYNEKLVFYRKKVMEQVRRELREHEGHI